MLIKYRRTSCLIELLAILLKLRYNVLHMSNPWLIIYIFLKSTCQYPDGVTHNQTDRVVIDKRRHILSLLHAANCNAEIFERIFYFKIFMTPKQIWSFQKLLLTQYKLNLFINIWSNGPPNDLLIHTDFCLDSLTYFQVSNHFAVIVS